MSNNVPLSKFVVLEGGEGVGKTTQLPKLQQWLTSLGANVVSQREPGGTKLAESIRPLVKDNIYPNGLNAAQEFALFSAARVSYLHEVVIPTLNQEQWLLSDRFAFSTLVYQGFTQSQSHPEFFQHILGLTHALVDDLWPDLTIVLDLDPAVGLARRAAGQNDGTRIEDKGLAFHQQVRQGYLYLAQQYPATTVVVDANAPEEVVFQRLQTVITKKLFT